MFPNAFVLVGEALVNPLSVCGYAGSDDERDYLMEEKMFEIAGILKIIVIGRIEEILSYIRAMIDEDFDCKKSFQHSKRKKKSKGTRELANLVSSISYDRGVKLMGS